MTIKKKFTKKRSNDEINKFSFKISNRVFLFFSLVIISFIIYFIVRRLKKKGSKMKISDTSINEDSTEEIEYTSKSTEPPGESGEITTPVGKDGTEGSSNGGDSDGEITTPGGKGVTPDVGGGDNSVVDKSPNDSDDTNSLKYWIFLGISFVFLMLLIGFTYDLIITTIKQSVLGFKRLINLVHITNLPQNDIRPMNTDIDRRNSRLEASIDVDFICGLVFFIIFIIFSALALNEKKEVGYIVGPSLELAFGVVFVYLSQVHFFRLRSLNNDIWGMNVRDPNLNSATAF